MNDTIPFDAPKTAAEIAIPEDVFPVPCGERGFLVAAERIFPIVAKGHEWFMRNGVVHEIGEGTEGHELRPLEKARAVSVLEEIAKENNCRIARFEAPENPQTHKIEPRWRTTTMPVSSMEVLLKTNAAAKCLPRIRQLVSCPILVTRAGGGCEVLGKGYHAHCGGTYVTRGDTPLQVSLPEAIEALLEIHQDFAFATEADRSRAIAVALSPALKMGGFINDDFPFHVAEATESQSGKDYLQKLHSRIYNAIPSVIVPPKGGVGSLDETISKALMAGKPFICLSNYRGRLESAILEAAIRGQGVVECRALRKSATVDTTSFLWQISTNGAEFTRDIANRSIITRIRKQPPAYNFHQYTEGDVLAHVTGNQSYYLGCVHAVVEAWACIGRLKTKDTRHDFRGWTQVMDWIVQTIFRLPPLLDGHAEEQKRVANPNFQWLRDLANVVITQGVKERGLTATELVEASDAAGLALPGRADSPGRACLRVGQILATLFKGAQEVDDKTSELVVDGMTVRREIRQQYDADKKENVKVKAYSFLPMRG